MGAWAAFCLLKSGSFNKHRRRGPQFPIFTAGMPFTSQPVSCSSGRIRYRPVGVSRNSTPQVFCSILPTVARACEFFRWICEADSGFVGCLQRNPVQEPHKTFWGRTAPFALSELVGYLPPSWKMPRVPKTAVGRNDGLFRALCSFVGRPSNYHVSQSELAAVADMKNQAFALHGLPPLDPPEVAGIVRSIYKRHQQKLSSGEQQRTFSFIQAARGRKSGQRRSEGSNEATQPWAAEGVSRRTWYRKKSGQHTGPRGRPKK